MGVLQSVIRLFFIREYADSLGMDLGEAGAGKMKLTSTVVDHILETTETSQSHEALAYFYCDRN
jgi:hypothetical protein